MDSRLAAARRGVEPRGAIGASAGSGTAENQRPASSETLHLRDLRRFLLRSGSWAGGIRIAGALLAFGVNVLLARLLPPGDLGIFFLLFSVASLAAIVASYGMRQSVVRSVAEALALGDAPRARAAVCAVLWVTSIGTSIVVLSLYAGLGDWLAIGFFQEPGMQPLVILLCAWTAVLAFQTPVSEAFRGYHDIRSATLFAGPLANLLLFALLLAAYSNELRLTSAHALAAAVASFAVSSAFALSRLYRRLAAAPRGAAPRLPGLLAEATPYFVTNAAVYLVAQAGLWIIGSALSSTEVATFGLALRLMYVVSLPLLVVNMVVQPLIAHLHTQGQRIRLQRVLQTAASLAAIPSTLVVLLLIVFAEPVLGLLFGPGFRDAAPVVTILAVAQIVNVWAGSCGWVLQMAGHQRSMMTLTVLSGLGSLAGCALVVDPYGLTGVAWAVSGGLIVQNALAWGAASRLLGIRTHADPRLLLGYISTARR